MFKEFDRTWFLAMQEHDDSDGEEACGNLAPGPSYGCVLNPHHRGLNHLAGIGDGYAIAEWDDDRSTDGED